MPPKKIYENVDSLNCSHLEDDERYGCMIRNMKTTLEGKQTNIERIELSSIAFGGIDKYIPIQYNAGIINDESYISILFPLNDLIKCTLEKSSLYCERKEL